MGNNLSKSDTARQGQKPSTQTALLQEERVSSLLGAKGKQHCLWESVNALKNRLLTYRALSRQAMIVLRRPLLLTFLCYEAAWQIYLAPTDVTRYQCYALTFWFGKRAITWLPAGQCAFLPGSAPQSAFHLLPLEYPPLTVLLFSLPLLAPFPYYSLAFALLMLLIVGIVHWLLNRFHSQQAAWRLLLYLGLGASVLVQVRFDLLPAAFMLLCLIAADRKRWGIAYSALAIGVLLKLYPLIALPALFIAEQRATGALASLSIAGAAESQSWLLRPIE